MMVCGIQCDMRGLMLPYMIVQMLYIILGITIGIGITVLFFFFNIIMGIVSAAVILILAFLMIYFWVAVQKAYIELGNRDYMYSPAIVSSLNFSASAGALILASRDFSFRSISC